MCEKILLLHSHHLHQAEGDASQREKLKLGNKLKESLREGIGTVATETMFLIRFPDITEHKFHDHIQVSNTLLPVKTGWVYELIGCSFFSISSVNAFFNSHYVLIVRFSLELTAMLRFKSSSVGHTHY